MFTKDVAKMVSTVISNAEKTCAHLELVFGKNENKEMVTFPSLIVGGSITKFSIFFLRLQSITTTQSCEDFGKFQPPD